MIVCILPRDLPASEMTMADPFLAEYSYVKDGDQDGALWSKHTMGYSPIEPSS